MVSPKTPARRYTETKVPILDSQLELKVLMEDIEHHVMEEEGEMFKMVEEQFDAETLEALGKELEAEKSKFRRSITPFSAVCTF